jgi:hypothetical protein
VRSAKKIGCVALAVVLLVVVCLPIAYALVLFALEIRNEINDPGISAITTPLAPAVVQDVCEKLDLPKDSPTCRPGATVYAPDFSPAIRAAFQPGVTTYTEIQQKLGKYQYECEPPMRYMDTPGYETFFRCHYALNPDRVFPFAFSFTENGILANIYTSAG